MLNRRGFVRSLGVGAVGALTSWGPGTARVAAQNGSRATLPATAIRIGSNENPYGPAASAIDAARLAALDGHRYAGVASSRLIDGLASAHSLPPERIMLSAGSGDLLRAAVRAFTSPTQSLVTGSPSYEQPVRQAKQAGVPVHEIPLTAALQLDLEPMLAKSSGAGLVYICNPNNPTSTIVPAAQVQELVARIAAASPATRVIVDEAYFEYADDPAFATLIPLVAQHPSLIIVRTFSKIHGMAGMRVGYAVAQEETLASLREHHSASGISVMSFAAAAAALADTAAMAKNQFLNRDVRAFTTAAFEKAGYKVAASQANFVMVDTRRSVRPFVDACRARGVAIGRPFPPLDTWARITIGTRAEMEQAIDVCTSVLASPPATVAAGPSPFASAELLSGC